MRSCRIMVPSRHRRRLLAVRETVNRVGRAAQLAARLPGTGKPVLLHITTIPMSLTFLRGQVTYMKGRGFDVRAISSSGPDLVAFARDEEIPVEAVSMARRITPLGDLRAVLRLVAILRRVRPEIVHAHTPKAGVLAMIASSIVPRSVRIYHMRGLPLMSATGWRRSLLWCAERLACSLADQVLCVSHSIRAEAIREGLCTPNKTTVLARGSGNGVDAKRKFNPERLHSGSRAETRRGLGIPSSATVIGFVGRIVKDKGVAELIGAWRAIREEFPDAHLLLVGPFEAQDPIAPETGLALQDDPRIHLTGMDWNTPPLYASMDLVVLPTYREGFPNVPLEAAAMGLPVVATRVPGCIDAVVDGTTGCLVPLRDVEALASAMRRYLYDPELRREHGVAGRRRVLREFRPEMVWADLYATYLRLLEDRGRPLPHAP